MSIFWAILSKVEFLVGWVGWWVVSDQIIVTHSFKLRSGLGLKLGCDNYARDFQNKHLDRFLGTLNHCQLSQPSFNLIVISIKTRSDNIFGPKPPTPPPPTHPTHPPGTQLCLILTKLLTFEVHHQNKRCLSILEESKNDVRLSWC